MGMEQEAAVNQLKKCLTEAPVLQIYNQEASATELHTDASMWGYEVVLLQVSDHDTQLHPVCFMSRKTTEAQQKYHSYELEVLAIVEAVNKFRVYLLGLHFKIITDCAAFTKQIAKDQILKVQLEQQKSFNKFRKEVTRYRIGDLVAIKRTQFLPTSKLSRKFLGPYRITCKEGQNRYKVLKIGAHEGPVKTYTASDFMKPWRQPGSSDEEEEEDVIQKGESVGVGVSPVERTCDRHPDTPH